MRARLIDGTPINIDRIDLDLLRAFPWKVRGSYVGAHRHMTLHREIAKRFKKRIEGRAVRFLDGDKRNFIRSNIAVCLRSDIAGIGKAHSDGASKYRGVFQSRGGRWTAHISHQKVRYVLGTFDTQREAAAVYDAKAISLRGRDARLNLVRKP